MSTILACSRSARTSTFTMVDCDGSATVELVGDHFRVSGRDREFEIGLCDYGCILAVVDRLIGGWQRQGEAPPRGLREWRLEKTRCSFSKQFHAEWLRLLEQVDPTVLAVQRAIFAATLSRCATPLPAEAYADEHIVHDVVTYRAAAVVASRLSSLTETLPRERLERIGRQIQESGAMRQLAEEYGITAEMLRVVPSGLIPLPLPPVLAPAPPTRPSADPEIAVLQNWRGILSYTGKPYRSLNRMLDQLPGGIPVSLVLRLRDVELERPITQRLELLALLHAADRYRAGNLPVFMHATVEQIRRSAGLIAESNRWGHITLRRSANVGQIVRYIQDYPDEHTGNIVGLAEKSIRWHRDRQEQERQRVIEQFGGDHETARPPVDPPSLEGVTFLASVGEVAEEGASMRHCLAAYAQDAVEGRCFLFHVEHKNETATVQVDYKGKVLQSYGPRNTANPATKWGHRMLSLWGREFPPAGELPPWPLVPAPQAMAPMPPPARPPGQPHYGQDIYDGGEPDF